MKRAVIAAEDPTFYEHDGIDWKGVARAAWRNCQAFISVQLERVLEKEEILARYLNTVYFGDSLHGVAAAARSYFHKPLRDLNLSEAAMLAGIIPAPSRYSPRSHPEAAERKRQIVLDALERHGLATPEEVAAARAPVSSGP